MNHSARLVNSPSGEWELYVVTDGPSRCWLTYEFRRIQPIPTLAERNTAMARLGYAAADDDAVWEWMEMRDTARADVRLLASLDVAPIGGAA
ncbi:DUF6303 family protein [Streptomyces sp. NRRL F-2664]|uniref:DUF6303 family protein n=1 Tax=Streptomyces sp. NRRL F-2664 TaxID=1463842 RepID=UPI00069186A0|nr:DUF6303 family protein [Streptomyces sp. NRRL F-2664]